MKKLLIACGLFLVIAALLGAQARPPATDPLAAARKALELEENRRLKYLIAKSLLAGNYEDRDEPLKKALDYIGTSGKWRIIHEYEAALEAQ